MENKMQYIKVPYVEKPVSRIFYGCAMKPFLGGEENQELFDAIIKTGVNTLDMARNYGKVERVVGRWMAARGNQDELVLLSKCGHPDMLGRKRVNEKAIRKDLGITIRELGTDFIDIYLAHRDDPDLPAGEIVEIFNALHAEGKIGAFGGSNWTHERIEEANEYAYAHNLIPFTVSSPNFGLADQVRDPWGGGCVTISGPANENARTWYRENQMPVIAYSSLARGFFSGRIDPDDPSSAKKVLDGAGMKGYYCEENLERLRRAGKLGKEKGMTVAQVAMSFIFSRGINVCAVVSTTKAERMMENIEAMNRPLSEEECRYLDLEG